MSDELRPCPFCGCSNLEIVTYDAKEGNRSIFCQECSIELFCNLDDISDLMRAWNTRVPANDEAIAALERVRAEIYDCIYMHAQAADYMDDKDKGESHAANKAFEIIDAEIKALRGRGE